MLKIKKGDTVKVIAGKDKGTEAKVLTVIPTEERILVEGVNVVTKHRKPNGAGQKGERISKEAPIHISNVMLVDPSTKKPTRVGFDVDADGNKKRIAKVSGKEIAQ